MFYLRAHARGSAPEEGASYRAQHLGSAFSVVEALAGTGAGLGVPPFFVLAFLLMNQDPTDKSPLGRRPSSLAQRTAERDFEVVLRALGAAGLEEKLQSTNGALHVSIGGTSSTAQAVTGSGTFVQLLAVPGVLRSVWAQVEPTLPSGNLWLFVLDATDLPIDGDVTALRLRVALVQHIVDTAEPASLDEVFGGVGCTTGALVVLSSTGSGYAYDCH